MTAKSLTIIRGEVRTTLRDGLTTGYDLTDYEINAAVGNALAELSEYIPLKSREAAHVSTSTNRIDTAGIDGLLEVVAVEYPVDLSPVSFYRFREIGEAVYLNGCHKPEVTEDIYLHCRKMHSLTDGGSTLRPNLERILVLGAAGYAAYGWCNVLRTQVVSALALISKIDTSISTMSEYIIQASDDLTAGRDFINAGANFGRPEEVYASYAAADLGNVRASLEQAGGFMKEMAATLSVTTAIKGYEGWASSQINAFKQALRKNSEPADYTEYR